jgi:AcrR family transcriptional regulator
MAELLELEDTNLYETERVVSINDTPRFDQAKKRRMPAPDETASPEPDAPARRASIGPTRSPDARDAILAAAEAVLLERGLKGFSIEAVARAAKAGKPTIYRWWPSRAALLLEVYHARKTQVCLTDSGSLEDDLTTYLTTILGNWRKPGAGALFRSVIAQAQDDAEAAAALAAYAGERRADMIAKLARARAGGGLRAKARPDLLAEALQSFAWARLLTDRLDLPPEEARAVVRQLLQGAAA